MKWREGGVEHAAKLLKCDKSSSQFNKNVSAGMQFQPFVIKVTILVCLFYNSAFVHWVHRKPL